MSSRVISKRVPWTELFRPRTLDEVILTRKQKAQILVWWRAWIIHWNINRLWNFEEREKWISFMRTEQGKTWYTKYGGKWREFFRAKFEEWAGSRTGKIPTSHYSLFETIGKKKELTTDLKRTATVEIKKWLNKTWGEFLSKIDAKEVPPAIPPLPPYKPILLVGPPGTGKTSTIYALAGQEGIVVVEFNASDKRNSRVIREIVLEAMKSAGFSLGGTIEKPPRIVLLDEVDGLSGKEDRGGFSALIQVLDEIKLPLALTANIIHDRKVRFLMARSATVFFDRPYDYQIKALISRIVNKTKMEVPEEIVRYLTKYAPDFRSVVEALETYYYTGVLPEIFHDQMVNIQDAIRYAFGFKGEDLDRTISMIQRYLGSVTDMDIWDIILWIWENAYNFLDRSRGIFAFYDLLAYADYLYRLGARNQNWRVAYRDSMNVLSYAIALYGKEVKNIWALRRIRVNKPTIIEELGRMKRLMEGAIVEEEAETVSETSQKKLGLRPLLELYGKHTHVSRKEARKELRFIVFLLEHDPKLIGKLFARLRVPKETLQLFVRHFIKKKSEREKIEKELFKAYEEELGKIGPRVVSLKTYDETQQLIETIKEEDEERKESEKEDKTKEGTTTLDMFFD